MNPIILCNLLIWRERSWIFLLNFEAPNQIADDVKHAIEKTALIFVFSSQSVNNSRFLTE